MPKLIVPNHIISVSGHDIVVDTIKSDEGFWLEKRDGRRFHKPKVIQQAFLHLHPLCEKTRVV